jgi:Na+/H+ antiporter NhaD/arsenite permease-like protein
MEMLVVMGPIALIGLVVTAAYFVVVYRKSLAPRGDDSARRITTTATLTNVPLLVVSLVLLALIIGTYIVGTFFGLSPEYIALSSGALATLMSRASLTQAASTIEWKTLGFFAGLFIIVGSLVSVGALEVVSRWLISVIGTDINAISISLLAFSGIVSGIVDNIPYVTSMIPVIFNLNHALGLSEPSVLWWALATGADFGGSLTVVGASANIVGVAIAHREGIKLSMWDYAKVGIPVTLLSLLATVPYFLFVIN